MVKIKFVFKDEIYVLEDALKKINNLSDSKER